MTKMEQHWSGFQDWFIYIGRGKKRRSVRFRHTYGIGFLCDNQKWPFVSWLDLTCDDLHAVQCLRSFLWGAAAHSKINNLNLWRRNFNRTLWTEHTQTNDNFFMESRNYWAPEINLDNREKLIQKSRVKLFSEFWSSNRDSGDMFSSFRNEKLIWNHFGRLNVNIGDNKWLASGHSKLFVSFMAANFNSFAFFFQLDKCLSVFCSWDDGQHERERVDRQVFGCKYFRTYQIAWKNCTRPVHSPYTFQTTTNLLRRRFLEWEQNEIPSDIYL